MGDFLAFRKMVTPAIIQVIFWIGVLVCVIAGLGAIVGGSALPSGFGGGGGALSGFLILVFGPLLVRVYCELLIVLFRIYDSLSEIQKNTARQ